MAKISVMLTVEFDQEAYDKEHGPGSEYWRKYREAHATPEEIEKKIADYKNSYSPRGTAETIVECLREGFYDWESKGWLKITVLGHAVCDKCGGVDKHKDWCESIAGPEASA